MEKYINLFAEVVKLPPEDGAATWRVLSTPRGTRTKKQNGRDSCESPAIRYNRNQHAGFADYLEAEAEAIAASAEAEAIFSFLAFLAFFGLAEASPEAMAAEAIAEPEAAAGAELWLPAKAETENRPAAKAAINLFILKLLKVN